MSRLPTRTVTMRAFRGRAHQRRHNPPSRTQRSQRRRGRAERSRLPTRTVTMRAFRGAARAQKSAGPHRAPAGPDRWLVWSPRRRSRTASKKHRHEGPTIRGPVGAGQGRHPAQRCRLSARAPGGSNGVRGFRRQRSARRAQRGGPPARVGAVRVGRRDIRERLAAFAGWWDRAQRGGRRCDAWTHKHHLTSGCLCGQASRLRPVPAMAGTHRPAAPVAYHRHSARHLCASSAPPRTLRS